MSIYVVQHIVKKSKAILVTGRGGLWGGQMLRIPYCLDLDNRLTDGGKVVSLRIRRTLLPRKIIFMFLVLISVRG
jgi:hypothetical protein